MSAIRRFHLAADTAVPQLAGTGPVTTQHEPVETTCEATYYDTMKFRLARASVALRRDVGWRLELPGERGEVRAPDSSDVPPELATSVRRYAEPAKLRPVAHLQITRRSHRLADALGRTVATLSDDHISGSTVGDSAHLDAWRELELEPAADAPDAVLTDITDALLDNGFLPISESMFHRLVAEKLPRPTPDTATAGDVVLSAVRTQVAAILRQDAGVRAGTDDAVHQLRVAMRKLRSILSAFRRVLDRDATRELADELRWAAGELSPARDTEVLRDRLTAALAELPDTALPADPGADLAEYFTRAAAMGERRALAALDSGRYARLLDRLDHLVADPPLTGRASRSPRGELRKAVRQAERRLHAAAADVDGAEDVEAALHEVRKKAKLARYTAEAASPVFGTKLDRWRRDVKAMQTVLGDHQDTVVTREVLRRLGDRAPVGLGFGYGVLYGEQLAKAAALRDTFARQWARLA